MNKVLLSLLCGVAALLSVSAARADTLDDIKSRGELVVGMEVAFRPYEFVQDGKPVGYDCDIANKLAESLGVKAKFVDTAWNGIIPALYTKKFDIVISGMAMTKERAARIQFSMPYSESGPIVLTRADNTTIHSQDDLSGRAVGTQLGSSTEVFGNALDAKLKAAGRPGFSGFRMYDHFPEAYIDLTNKRIEAVLIGKVSALTLMQAQPGKYAINGSMGITSYTGMAIRKDDATLAAAANKLLAAMKSDGSLAALQMKWMGATMDTPNTVPDNLP